MTTAVQRRSEHRVVPWHNKQGLTEEIACAASADGGGFDWRISMARVTENCAFSLFPGVDRVLVQVSGDPMTLTVDGQRHLLRLFEPFAFAGEAVTGCDLEGQTLDLNVMTRRGAWTSSVECVALSGAEVATEAGFAVALDGSPVVDGVTLALGDVVRDPRTLGGTGVVALISLRRV
ncbi:MAG: HutD family protein [Nocardioidaceae bacterium]|nr:HutD family protein [Nocardioidaceae bacterium]